MKSSQALSKFLPLIIGYFALSVPSGLSLYWFTNNILSTTQQVWLQKLGGAKNQVRQFSNNPVKEVQQKLEISGTDVNFTEVTPFRKEEKSSSGGPPPGERFRQLKEQEARRRQRREEEKMKLEAKGSEMTYEEQKEVKLVEKSDGKTEGDVIVVQDDIVQSKRDMHHSSGNTVLNVNGGYSAQVSDADQSKMPGLSKDTGDMTKEEAVEIYNTTIENTDTAAFSGENKNNRVEQQKEDGD